MRKLQLCGLILLAIAMLAMPSGASAQIAVGISVHIGPPAIPVYPQPICPGAGYMWTPGYWAYGPDRYYWVPGTWVVAPAVGLLWTPGYWGWGGAAFIWHAGYWGPHIGFYGGINYGFGYGGVGFVGGRWNGGVFAYNTAVMNVNRVAYNGGQGGLTARPTAAEMAAANEHHIAATQMQMQHEHAASQNRALLASENHGRPAIAATSKAGEFNGHGVVAASAAAHTTTSNSNRPPSNAANTHADRPPSAGNGSSNNHPSNQSATHNSSNPPKNQSHSESKPEKAHSDNKPHKD